MKILKIEKNEDMICITVSEDNKKNEVKFVNIFLIISLPHPPLSQVRNSSVDTWCPKGRYLRKFYHCQAYCWKENM